MQKAVFKILGMKCHSCAKVIKFGLEDEDGINSADVDFGSERAFLSFNSGEINTEKIKDKIKNLGYKAIEE